MLYLDAAATTPVRREALEAMWPFLTGDFGNPSSHHTVGESAARALATARTQVADWLGCRPGEVVFTSGGTEADNLAIKGIALGTPRGRHLVTSRIEHEAVLESVEFLRRFAGFEVSYVDLDDDGTVTPTALAAVLRDDTTLVSIAHANNEIGTVQPLAALTEVTAERRIPFHTDAVQSAGWLDTRIDRLGVQALSLSGHKLGAPKGVGALYVAGRLPVEPLVHGGGQERGRRSGTENVAGAVALGVAATLAEAEREARAASAAAARDAFITEVLARVPAARLTGPVPAALAADPARSQKWQEKVALVRSRESGSASHGERLPANASFVFPGTSGESVLLELERRGVVSSSGSACAAGSDEPSHVLTALGFDPDLALTSVRFTWGSGIGAQELAPVAEHVAAAVQAVRGLAG